MEEIEYKKCTNPNCENPYLPATTEYFYEYNAYNKKIGSHKRLLAECKACRNKYSRKRKKEKYDEIKPKQQTYYIENKSYWKKKNAEYYGTPGERLDMKHKREKKWKLNNPDRYKYHQDKHSNKDHIISKKEWKSCKEHFGNSCAYCGLHINDHYRLWGGKLKQIDLHKEHVDSHGSMYLDNCVPSCQSCNSSKHIYALDVWYNDENPVYSLDRYKRIVKWLSEDYKIYFEGFRERRNTRKNLNNM